MIPKLISGSHGICIPVLMAHCDTPNIHHGKTWKTPRATRKLPPDLQDVWLLTSRGAAFSESERGRDLDSPQLWRASRAVSRAIDLGKTQRQRHWMNKSSLKSMKIMSIFCETMEFVNFVSMRLTLQVGPTMPKPIGHDLKLWLRHERSRTSKAWAQSQKEVIGRSVIRDPAVSGKGASLWHHWKYCHPCSTGFFNFTEIVEKYRWKSEQCLTYF